MDGHIPPEFIQDPPAVNQPEIAHIVGRDPERTPMQWDASPHAGFTVAAAQPWLPVAANYPTCNVAAQNEDPTSMLSLYRALARLRWDEAALRVGDYEAVATAVTDIFAYPVGRWGIGDGGWRLGTGDWFSLQSPVSSSRRRGYHAASSARAWKTRVRGFCPGRCGGRSGRRFRG
jgi:hypothetical protein